MKILIDADGCPVTRLAIEIAGEYEIKCVVICDTAHGFEIENVEVITVDKGKDSADFKLVNMVCAGDIIVTQDYGLASMCLSKKGYVINQNGMIYNEQNIDSLLFSRYASKKARDAKKHIKGPKKRLPENDEKFIYQFKKLIEEIKSRSV